MEIKYKIRKFEPSFGQIIVEYTTPDGAFNAEFSLDIPIKEDNTYIVGKELEAFILSSAPTWHLERKTQVYSGVTNADAIMALVEPYPIPDPAELQLI